MTSYYHMTEFHISQIIGILDILKPSTMDEMRDVYPPTHTYP